MDRVLLTGAAGYLSGFIIDALKHDYQVTLFDRVEMETDLPFVQGDICDLDAVVADGSSRPSQVPLLPGDAISYSPGELNYCISKKIGEVLAAAYAQAHGTSTIHLRPGVIAGDGANPGPDPDTAGKTEPWFIYVDPRDVAAAVRCALQTDRASGTYNIVAGRADSLFDWHPARREIGYAPQHNWPEIEEVC